MRSVFIGEAMLELSQDGAGWRMGYGGDTLNVAVHLARAGISSAYLTALGTDPLSAGLKAQWQAEGLDTSLVLTNPARTTGLYAIATDATGERTFTYWRDTSAAREIFGCSGAEHAVRQAESADLLGFSLITLAILEPAARTRLLDLAATVRAAGGQVAFDSNYRAHLWTSAEQAAAARDNAIAVATIGLPTLEDEVALSGFGDASAIAAHWTALGCKEVVVKLGADGCRLPDGTLLAPPRRLQPLDTSGAGDAFNGGYLASRLRGVGPCAAAQVGNALAGWCVMRPGAIPHLDDELVNLLS
jgi:2-dehydro-3-deoxygluconokinase